MPLSEDDKRFIVHALGAHAALTSVAAGGDLSAVVEYISRATGESCGLRRSSTPALPYAADENIQ